LTPGLGPAPRQPPKHFSNTGLASSGVMWPMTVMVVVFGAEHFASQMPRRTLRTIP
jgi:hypothetical protein